LIERLECYGRAETRAAIRAARDRARGGDTALKLRTAVTITRRSEDTASVTSAAQP
jgi:hypothetical protein